MDSGAAAIIKESIRIIEDYPKKGISFKDITPLLKDGNGFRACIDGLEKGIAGKRIDYVAGIEARGFIIGSALAYAMGVGFVPIRKKGKLPYRTVRREYPLEYGNDTIEMHVDAFEKGSSVLIADDLLATGGTARAASELITEAGGKIAGFAFIVELTGLNGREKLAGHEIVSLVQYLY
jgi:adenine phosphoribosyltransferase